MATGRATRPAAARQGLSERARLREEATRAHYDSYPYEVQTRGSVAYASDQTPVGRFIGRLEGGLVLDLGCGPGNLLPALCPRTERTVGLDISAASLRRATAACSGRAAYLVRGSALSLPFGDGRFDAVIAAGILHHTPDPRAAFYELCRVLRPGGKAFVAVYARPSYYSLLYHTAGVVARWAERSRLGALLLNRILLLPVFALYMILGRLVVHRRLALPSYRETLNYFADQLLNPVVSFHDPAEIRDWASAERLYPVSVMMSHGGALMNVELLKAGAVDDSSAEAN